MSVNVRVEKVIRETSPNSWEVLLRIEGESIVVLKGIEPKKGAILEMEFLDRPAGAALEIVDVVEQIDSETWRVRVRGVEFQVVELEGSSRPIEGELLRPLFKH
jgi:hypothetical protein